jgi:hypothetical protein
MEEAERKRKEDDEAKWDLIYMGTAVALTVGIITFFMVSLCLPSLTVDANASLAFRRLASGRSLRHCLRAVQRADGPAPRNKLEDSRCYRSRYEEDRRGHWAQRAISLWRPIFLSICIITAQTMFFESGTHTEI